MPKAGPRSKVKVKESVIVQRRGGSLGESSTPSSNDEDDTHPNETATQTPRRRNLQRNTSMIPVKPSEGFRTPDSDVNATDYGLDFTTSHIQNPSPRRCSTLRTGTGSSQEESATRNPHPVRVQDKENEDRTTPTTGEISKARQKSKQTKTKQTKAAAKPLSEKQTAPNTSTASTTSDETERERQEEEEDDGEEETRGQQEESSSRIEQASLKKKPTKKSAAPAAKKSTAKSKKVNLAQETAQTSTAAAAQDAEATTSHQAAAVKKKRKQKTPMQKDLRFLRDVQKLQGSTHYLIPRLPFSRVIREIMMSVSRTVDRITPTALEALQAASEMYLTQRLQDAYMLTLHRGRVTLDVRDMQLINFLKMHM
ncbi:centromere identifier [Musca autumnalis]|uniref:centromere identifier n=1 Tax=Musca autumnalis TaxID=221902 RepID=UPI003CEEADCE